MVMCLRSAQLVGFPLELKGKLPACRGTASDPARAPHGFFLHLYSPTSQALKAISKVLGSKGFICHIFLKQRKTPLSLGMLDTGRE